MSRSDDITIVDSQVHIWEEDRPDRPWPAGQKGRSHREGSFGYVDLLQEMDAAGVARAILVPPSYEGDRNDVVLKAARQRPDRFRAMARFPVERQGGHAELHALLADPHVLGLRLTFHLPQFQRHLVAGDVDWFWPEAEAVGLKLMVLPTGSLPALAEIIERYPGISFVIDHCSLHRTLAEQPFIDLEEIKRLVALERYPNVAVKVSAMPFFSREQYPFRDVQAVVKEVFEAFGPRRTFWGSDVTRLSCGYGPAISMFTNEMPWLDGQDKHWVMGRGLCEWLEWPL